MTLYDDLEINTDASPEEIRRSYRRLALQYHPDKNNNSVESTQRFQQVTSAYEILSDVDTFFRGIIEAYDLLHRYKWIFFLLPTCHLNDTDLISYLSINQYNQISLNRIVHLSKNIAHQIYRN